MSTRSRLTLRTAGYGLFSLALLVTQWALRGASTTGMLEWGGGFLAFDIICTATTWIVMGNPNRVADAEARLATRRAKRAGR